MSDLDPSTIATFTKKSVASWTKSGDHDLFADALELDSSNVRFEYKTLSDLITVHEDFLFDSNDELEQIILNTFANSLAKAEDKAFISGTGEDEPLGILVDSDIKSLSAKNNLV